MNDRAFIDELGFLWIYQNVNDVSGFMRFEGMSDLKTSATLHPVFSSHMDFPPNAIDEISIDKANEIIDRYWSECIESFLNREF